jgi:hypothetical protein
VTSSDKTIPEAKDVNNPKEPVLTDEMAVAYELGFQEGKQAIIKQLLGGYHRASEQHLTEGRNCLAMVLMCCGVTSIPSESDET